MSKLYEHFGSDFRDYLDFSEDALYEIYAHESEGKKVSHTNGYYAGKRWLNVTVAMWKEDLWVTLFPWELGTDPNYPRWFLESVFGKDAVDWYTLGWIVD